MTVVLSTYLEFLSVQQKQPFVLVHPHVSQPRRVYPVCVLVVWKFVGMKVAEDVSDPRARDRLESTAALPYLLDRTKNSINRLNQFIFSFFLLYIDSLWKTFPDFHRPSRPSYRRSCQCPKSTLSEWQTIHRPLWARRLDRLGSWTCRSVCWSTWSDRTKWSRPLGSTTSRCRESTPACPPICCLLLVS